MEDSPFPAHASRRPGVQWTHGFAKHTTFLARSMQRFSRHTAIQQTNATLAPHMCIFSGHAPRSRRSMELPHGQRPALKTHAAASHLTSPCLSGSPVHAPAILRRPHHAVSTARMSSPHARTPSGVEPVQLRGNRRPICLSPWSSGNHLQLRTTRVGLATGHRCGEIHHGEGMFGECSREYSTNKKGSLLS